MPKENRSRPRTGDAEGSAAFRRTTLIRNAAIVALIIAVVAAVVIGVTDGFSSKSPSATGTTTTTAPPKSDAQLQASANRVAAQRHCPTSPRADVNTHTWPAAPALTITPTKTFTALFATTLGGFAVTLDAKQAPQAVNNFVFLAGQNYFTCMTFDRAVPDMYVASGDPSATVLGGPGYTIPAENVPTTDSEGDLVMVKSAAGTSGSQFIIVVHNGSTSLPDGSSVFGHVSSGLDVLQEISVLGNPTASKDGRTPNVVHRILGVTVHQT